MCTVRARSPVVRPLQGTGAEVWHSYCFQPKLKAHSAVPGHEEGVFIYQLSALATGELPVLIDALNFRYDPDHVVPVISLRSKRPEEARHITQLRIS